MPSRILRPGLTRLAAGALALLVAGGVMSSAPAHAAGGTPHLAQSLNGNDADPVEALRRVVTAESAYGTAQRHRDLLAGRVEDLRRQAAAAAARAEQLSARVDDSTAGILFDAVTSFVTGDQSEVDLAVQAVDDERFTLRLLGIADKGLTQAALDVAAAKKELSRARAAAAEVRTREAAMDAARAAIRRAQFGRRYGAEDDAQGRRNQRALEGWTTYLTKLARAGVVPPHAEALADPGHLVSRFEPVHDGRGGPVAGVAEIDTADGPLLVLPAETVRAVSTAFSRVGLPAGMEDGRAWACGGFAAAAWGPTALGVPATAGSQWRTLAAVPVASRQIGDLLYTDADGTDPSQVAVVVSERLVVTADPTTGVSAVERLGRHTLHGVIGARRPTLPTDAGMRVDSSRAPECQEPEPVTAAPASASGGWTVPVPSGYAPSTPFGVVGPLWSSGQHTGLDFAAPTGTPVFAARGGTVSIERPEWAGRLVRIDHGDGLETWYAHLSAVDVVPGEQVRPGTRVGAVGSAGNTTGPHLHFEVRAGGVPTDPAAALELAVSP